jgi:hypothetical protein
MKITVSFVSRSGRSAPWLASGLVAAGVIQLIVALAFAVQGWGLRAEHSELEARLARAKQTAEAVAETPLPPQPALYQLRSRVAAVNQVTGTGGDALTDVLQRLETNLPDDVALISLRYQRRQREILAVAETNRADMLSEVLQRFEHNAVFREVRLVRQSERAGARGGMQFELRFKD